MKTLSIVFLTLVMAQTSFSKNVLSPTLVKLDSFRLEGNKGKILKINDTRAMPQMAIVSIPIVLDLPNACTTFVGQIEKALPAPTFNLRQNIFPTPTPYKQIEVVGSVNPMSDVCIAVIPQPMNIDLTLNVSVPSGVETTTQNIKLGKTNYIVTVDFKSSEVTISQMMPALPEQF